jgi:ABC-type molybdate transport system substrate-binding protein
MDLQNIKIFKKIYEDRTSISNLLINNHNSYTILLGSQIKNHDEFLVLSDLKNQHIFYQALVIAGDNMETAREFLKFLKTKQAKDIFAENGFMVDK